jgi:hypothetical protein
MHIITIMNYKKAEEILMCKIWIYLAKRFNPNASITILFNTPIPEIKTYAERFSMIRFIKIKNDFVKKRLTHGYVAHPMQELQLAVWKVVELLHIKKFIYLDADAYILDSLKEWWDIIDSKPYIAISERLLDSRILFNCGIHSYSSTKRFITYKKLLTQYHADGNTIKIISGEQGLTNAYFRRIGYDCSHPLIGHQYNSIAKYCAVKKATDNEIIVYSGRYPLIEALKRFISDRGNFWWEDWLWWNKPKKVIILHAFGGESFKYWNLPECKKLWDYCKSKVA